MGFLLFALLFGTGSFSDLDNVSGEWIDSASGFTKTELLDLTEYGELINGAKLGAHVCFVEEDGQEYWRATVVYADRVILFQEDHEPVVTLHDFPATSSSFSDSGRYVVLHDGAETDTGSNAVRINAETGEKVLFDSELQGFTGYSDYAIWEDGSLVFMRTIDSYTRHLRFFFLDSNLQLTNTFDALGAANEVVSNSYFAINHSEGLTCFDKNGNQLWTMVPEDMCVEAPVVLNNDVIIIPNVSAIIAADVNSGSIINKYSLDERANGQTLISSSDGNSWILQSYAFRRDMISYFGVGSSLITDVSLSIFASTDFSYILADYSSSGFMFFKRSKFLPVEAYYLILNSCYCPIYQIEANALDGSSHCYLRGREQSYVISNRSLSFLYLNKHQLFLIAPYGGC